jgi:hypothetical protein
MLYIVYSRVEQREGIAHCTVGVECTDWGNTAYMSGHVSANILNVEFCGSPFSGRKTTSQNEYHML